jgi:CRP-like cAMP-binding protein
MAQSATRDTTFIRVFAEAAKDGDALSIPRWQPADWSTFFAYADLVRMPRGSVLIEKDAAERALYLVATGLLEVTTILGGMAVSSLAKVHPGSVVAELSFFDGRPRSAKVWSIADSDLYRVDFNAFESFADAHPRLACDLLLGIGRVVSGRLRSHQAHRARY